MKSNETRRLRGLSFELHRMLDVASSDFEIRSFKISGDPIAWLDRLLSSVDTSSLDAGSGFSTPTT